MKGYITKGIGGFYYVKTPEGIVECKPRGIFRKQKITPVAGDEVTLETENGAAVIAEIAPRKNVFVRPPVANLDVLFLVASTTQPTPSTLVLDKLSAIAVDKGVQPVIVCTKADLGEVEFLRSAYETLRPGGILVYSTCTFAPAEDEGSIGRFLKRHPEFYVEEVPLAEGMSHGLGELSATIRLWPHKLRGEGHYVAVLRKEGTLADGGSGLLKNGYENGITAGDSKSAAAGIPEYLAFAGETFAGDALEKYAGRECRYLKFGEQLYRIPEGMPSVKGLKVLRPGLHLGTAKKGRFEPSHALALTLHAADVLHTMDLPSDGREIRGYLNGETFPAQGEKGWYLITVDGYSTGWGKLAGGIMKNHYPKGLRKRLP